MGQQNRAGWRDEHPAAFGVAGIQAHWLGNRREKTRPVKLVESAGVIAVARIRIDQHVAVGQ